MPLGASISEGIVGVNDEARNTINRRNRDASTAHNCGRGCCPTRGAVERNIGPRAGRRCQIVPSSSRGGVGYGERSIQIVEIRSCDVPNREGGGILGRAGDERDAARP